MKKRTLRAVSAMLYVAVDGADNTVEQVAHEVAHKILLFGRVCSKNTDARCDAMAPHRANAHEVRAIALELAGLKALGYRQSVATVIENSFDSFRDPSPFVLAIDLRRAIKACKPSRRSVRKFVETYRALERFV